MPPDVSQHDQLPPDHIRLVRLHRHGCGCASDVCIDIFAIELKDAQHYEALSYRWDEESPKETIIANGKMIDVMQPVYNFLLWRQSEHEEHLLWIDSLCIEQDGETGAREKEVQVPLMGAIFHQADRVLAWLGDVKFVQEAKALMASMEDGSYVPLQLTKENMVERHIVPSWQGLAHLLGHEWFTRIWISQEIILAKELALIAGNITIEWKDFLHVVAHWKVDEISPFVKAPVLIHSAAQGLIRLPQLRELRLQQVGTWDIADLFILSGGTCATILHDQVFAILGLYHVHRVSPQLQPRYDLPVGEVFRQATVAALKESSRPLSILPLVGYEPSNTWMPTSWTMNLAKMTLPQTQLGRLSAYTAAIHIQPHIEFPGDSPLKLQLGGNCIDKIIRLGLEIVDYGDSHVREPDGTHHLQAFMRDIDKLIMDGVQTGDYGLMDDMVWKTLIWYSERLQWPTPDDVRKWYAAFRWYMKHDFSEYPDDPTLVTFTISDDEPDDWDHKARDAMRFIGAFTAANRRNRVAVTEFGRLAMVPTLTEVGDLVCILWGANMPHLLRSVKDTAVEEETYKLIGHTYILDYMWGNYADEASGQVFTIT